MNVIFVKRLWDINYVDTRGSWIQLAGWGGTQKVRLGSVVVEKEISGVGKWKFHSFPDRTTRCLKVRLYATCLLLLYISVYCKIFLDFITPPPPSTIVFYYCKYVEISDTRQNVNSRRIQTKVYRFLLPVFSRAAHRLSIRCAEMTLYIHCAIPVRQPERNNSERVIACDISARTISHGWLKW